MSSAVENADSVNARKKAQIVNLLRDLIKQVETEHLYGEFGVSFSAQNGQIGHFEETLRKTYK